MTRAEARGPCVRRARPLLGTLVEIGLRVSASRADECIGAGFSAISDVQRCMSRFEADSDIARFDALPVGGRLDVNSHTACVLAASHALHEASDGLFDVTLGTAPSGWRGDGRQLYKLRAEARIDLGGIGKGYAVDCAVRALAALGCDAGWVNAGGDVRAFGDVEVPLWLRDERYGGVRPFATLRDGAFATSRYGPGARCQAACPSSMRAVPVHASVAAPQCLWADALTKLVALMGPAAHPLLAPLLARHGAQAWLH